LGVGPPVVFSNLKSTAAAPLFPGFGKGGRYNSQSLEFLIYLCM
jgi:hypothetical protein